MADPSEETTPKGGESGWRVDLGERFEGPLDLLLHLIKQHELDIMDIPIGFVCEKYFEYIRAMQEVSIDVASEYLVMAAELTHIKSRMLLPSPPEEEDSVEEEGDPRAELIRRLLEYQKYKTVSEQLADRSLLGRDVFVRGAAAPGSEEMAPLAPVSLFKLIDAFQGIIERARVQLSHEVDFERISITERIAELSDVLRQKIRVRFDELFVGARTRGDLIVTFLALLEMTRLRMTRIAQAVPLGPIEIELAVTDDSTDPPEAEPVGEGREESP